MKRYLTAVLDIYPSVKALVDKDLDHAAKQQLANQLQQQGQQGQQGQQQGQQGQQGQQQGQQGQQQGQPGQAGQSQQSGGQQGLPQGGQQDGTSGSNGAWGIQKRVQDEINQRAAKHQEDLRKQLGRDLENLDRHLDGKDPASGASGDSGRTPPEKELSDAIDALKKKVAERFNDKDSEEQRKALDRQLETFEKLNNAIKEQSSPLDQLSQEAQKAIEEEFQKLTREEREALKQKAKELLEDLEDKIRESMESEMQENTPQKHGDRRRDAEQQRRAAQKDKELSEKIDKMENDCKALLGAWDQIREEVAPYVTTLYSRLERLLRPTVPEWDSGHASGSRVNPFAVMQAKADRRLSTKIWDKKTLPVEKICLLASR